jgi:hypothetical protein
MPLLASPVNVAVLLIVRRVLETRRVLVKVESMTE